MILITVKIYSDGSKQQNGSVGAAIYVDDISATFSWRLDPFHSVLTAELYAILQGILFAVNHLENQDTVIFSDSLSALEIIQNPVKKGLNRIVNAILRQIYLMLTNRVKIVLQWIPSHKGIIGNNIVDQIAKTACTYDTITHVPLEYNDVLKLVNENLYAARLSYWNQIKHNLHFFKAVPNINQWEWISLNNRRYDVLLARLRIGCVCKSLLIYHQETR